MLRLYPSNKTESLAQVMAALIKAQPLQDPFSSEVILIQSQGMGVWLQQQLSDKLGIAAMVETSMPAAFVWKLSQALLDGDGVSPAFDKSALRWEIYRLLPDCLSRPEFSGLQEYVQALSSHSGADLNAAPLDGLTRFRISEAIADSFDAYQNYRGDWLQAWESDSLLLQDESLPLQRMEQWQAALWQALYPELSLADRTHRPRQLDDLLASLRKGKFDRNLLPERLFVFGMTALPPQWLSVFIELSRYIDVHFLIQNPCQYYWGDLQNDLQALRYQQSLLSLGQSTDTAHSAFLERNALLASWGKLGRDYLSLLYSYDETDGVEEFSASLFDSWLDDSSSNSTALHYLQENILHLDDQQHRVSVSDQSLRFAACYSRLREVEALRDYVLQQFNDNADLSPKDIIVMMPNVQDYASLVDAVFSVPVSTEAEGDQFLPYAISDQSVSFDEQLLAAFQQILSLDRLRITSNEVMDWLEQPAIRLSVGIQAEELEVLHGWLQDLNVRWGLSDDHRNALSRKPLAASQNTWLVASRRLLSAYVVGGEDAVHWQGEWVLPVAMGTREAQQLAGRLLRFIDVIEQTIALFDQQQTGIDWLDTCYEVWQLWFDADAVPESFQRFFDHMLAQLRKEFVASGLEEKLAYSVVSAAINGMLEQERVSQRFLAGRINFCTLMPMRSIPFKVVCLLGMNEGEYPRPVVPSSFDLMTMSPTRRGDRSRREDDRYLFLEALLSVREKLYISYVGRSAIDNSERFPSVLVSELIEYAGNCFVDADEAPINVLADWHDEHRLQPFSRAYYEVAEGSLSAEGSNNQTNAGLPRTYDRLWFALHDEAVHAEQVTDQGRFVEDEPMIALPAELGLSELRKAFNHPLRHYYQYHFGVSPPNMLGGLEESEPFALDGLDLHELKRALLHAEQSTSSNSIETFESVHQHWQLSGKLPAAPLDRMEMGIVDESLAILRGRLAALGEIKSLELSHAQGDTVLRGQVSFNEGGLLSLHLGQSPSSQFFGFWFEHVLWNAYRHSAPVSIVQASTGQSRLICADNVWVLPTLDREKAETYLSALLSEYQTLLSRPLFLLPKTAFASLFETASKVKTAFEGVQGGHFQMVGEISDFYYQRALQYSGNKPVIQENDLPDFGQIEIVKQIAACQESIECLRGETP